MVEETVTLIVIIVVGVLLGGAAFLAGWSDENRLFNPAFWFFGVPCGFIAAMMVPGGLEARPGGARGAHVSDH